MTRHGQAVESVGLRVWAVWRTLAERGRSAAAAIVAMRRGSRLSPAARDRVIDLIEGDLNCLIEDVTERPTAEQPAKELLLNREVLVWLRGGPVPGQEAVDLLEENVAVFYRAPAEDEQANGRALRAARDELVRAQAAAESARRGERDMGATGFTERERGRFGRKLDERMMSRGMTIGELAARSGIEVISIVAFIYGAEEPGSAEMMTLAAALRAEPRELFPECLVDPGDDEGRGGERR